MLVVCNGGHRTGSTLAYNIVRLIFETKGIGHALGGFEVDQALIERHANQGDWRVVKTHLWVPETSWDNVRILCTYRNPLDVAASLVRKPPPVNEDRVYELLTKQREVIKALQHRTDTLFLRYEEMYREMQCWIREIARFVGVETTADEMARIRESLSIDQVIRFCNSLEADAADETTQWRRGHVSPTRGEPGAWKTVLSPECVEKIRREFGSGESGA